MYQVSSGHGESAGLGQRVRLQCMSIGVDPRGEQRHVLGLPRGQHLARVESDVV